MKIDHITLSVTSLTKSMAYYGVLLPLLGFEQVKKHIWTDRHGFYFQFRQADPGTNKYEPYRAGMNHLGFAAMSHGHVKAIRASMAEAGFDVPNIQIFEGAEALFLKDPDGIRFEIAHTHEGHSPVD